MTEYSDESGDACTKFSMLKRRTTQWPRERHTVPLYKSKIFIIGSCTILVWTMVLVRPRRADSKNGVENYQGPTNSHENAIRKSKFPPYIVLNLRLIMA